MYKVRLVNYEGADYEGAEFIADANKSKLGVDPVTGEEVDEIVRSLFKLQLLG